MSLPKKIRIKELLVKQGLVTTEKEGVALILAGLVIVNKQRVDKPGTLINPDAPIRIKQVKNRERFVSRAGEKLHAAIKDFDLTDAFKDKSVLDVGASTGGFTDCLLSFSADRVVSLDVGTNQLDWKLRNDARVTSVEKTDVRTFDPAPYGPIDWVVADVSFVSLARLAPALLKFNPRSGYLLLVKPQFELPSSLIPKGGIVTDESHWQKAVATVQNAFTTDEFSVAGSKASQLKGRQGNQEFFVWISRSALEEE